jgi:hypothetical protein
MSKLWVVSAPSGLVSALEFADIYVGLEFAQGFLQVFANRSALRFSQLQNSIRSRAT